MTTQSIPEPKSEILSALDLLTAYLELVHSETSRKARTALRAWARAYRPELWKKNYDEDEILAEIPLRGLLAGYPDVDTALKGVVTTPISDLIVNPCAIDKTKLRNTANVYSSAARHAFQFGLEVLNLPLLGDGQLQSSVSDKPTGVLPYSAYVQAQQSKTSAMRVLKADKYHYWHPKDWPDGPRQEWERWVATVTIGEQENEKDPFSGVRKLEEATIELHERAFACFFGGLRFMGLLDDESFTRDRFYALLACTCNLVSGPIQQSPRFRLADGNWYHSLPILNMAGRFDLQLCDCAADGECGCRDLEPSETAPHSDCHLVRWTKVYVERAQSANCDDEYVPHQLTLILINIATFVKHWYYRKTPEGREQYRAWGYKIPPKAIHAYELFKVWDARECAWKEKRSTDGSAVPRPEDTWGIVVKTRDHATSIKDPRHKGSAYETAAILAVGAFLPLRAKNICDARLLDAFDPNVTGFYRDRQGIWWVHVTAEDYKTDRPLHRQLDKSVNEFMDPWVAAPDQRAAIFVWHCQNRNVKNRAGIRRKERAAPVDQGFMFPSFKTGGRMSEMTLRSLVKRYSYRASGGTLMFSPHKLRTGNSTALFEETYRTTGSAAATRENGAALSAAQLGHSNLKTSQEYYNKIEDDMISQQAQKLITTRIARAHGPFGRWERRLGGLIDLLEVTNDDAEHLWKVIAMDSSQEDFSRLIRGIGVVEHALPWLWGQLYPERIPYPETARPASVRMFEAVHHDKGKRYQK